MRGGIIIDHDERDEIGIYPSARGFIVCGASAERNEARGGPGGNLIHKAHGDVGKSTLVGSFGSALNE